MNTKDIQDIVHLWRQKVSDNLTAIEDSLLYIIDHIWKTHQHINGVRAVCSCHQRMIDNLDERIKALEGKRTDEEHIEPISAENPQETAESAQHCGECCGNCAHFGNEDSDGQGWCGDCEFPTKCSDSCSKWSHRELRNGDAVMWKTIEYNRNEVWKLGFYCAKIPFGHSVRTRKGGTVHNVQTVIPFDTFDPYKQ